MNVSQLQTTFISNLFNDPGSGAGGAISNQMLYDWCNMALNDYWALLSNNEWGYFAIRQSGFPGGANQTFSPLNITSNTSVYPITNQSTTTNTTSQSIARITKMYLRTGSSPGFGYQMIPPVEFPTERYNNLMSNFLTAWNNATNNAPLFFWSANIGGLDANNNPTWYVEFSPIPSLSGTVVFDGVRYPAKVAALTDVPDLPEHLHWGLGLRMAKYASIYDKAAWPEVDKKIEEFDQLHLPLERRGVQADGPNYIKCIDGW